MKSLLLTLAAALASPALHAQSCQVRSGATVPTLIELYTSEGCDSCPAADRWLSGLKGRSDVLAAAFHVDYWDQLGWKDRFASPAHTARQAQGLASTGARFAYTPQIIVNGRDWRGSSLPSASNTAPAVALQLQRGAGDQVRIELQPLAGAPAQLKLWWAAVEDGHQSEVKAGENRGATLKHDDVVRDYGSVMLMSAAGAQGLSLKAPSRGEGGRARRLLVVASDALSGRILQAVELGC